MKAVIFTEYGSPDVLQYTDIEKPTPTDDEVLVKIHAVSANPLDWHIMRGEPFLARLDAGLTKPKNHGLGADIAGEIEAIGKDVTEFQVGDAVFGDVFQSGLGGFAEYVAVPVTALVSKPSNTSFVEASAAPVAALTALQGLRDTGKIRSGQQVLINGASGGVGTYAVQIAKSYDTEVTGVCSTRNHDMVRSIGADHVIDYTKEDFTQGTEKYDLIFDAVGNRSVSDMKRALKPSGICSIAGFTTLPRMFDHLLLGPLMSMFGDKTVKMMGTASTNKDDMAIIKDLLASSKIKSVIDKCYPLSKTADAIRYLETGRARGKVVITII